MMSDVNSRPQRGIPFSMRKRSHSFSPAKPFELKLYSGTPGTPILFDKPGTVVVGCNIHDQMVAYILVVDTPYFGKTDAAGTLTLSIYSNRLTRAVIDPELRDVREAA